MDNEKTEKELLAFFDEKKPFKVPCGPTAYFDCDDTLVMWDLPEGVEVNSDEVVTIRCRDHSDRLYPNKYNIDLLIKFAKRGHSIVVWSAAGADWAEEVVQGLGLCRYVHVVTGKPSYYIDDIADSAHWAGKHGYFDINGKRFGTQTSFEKKGE